MIVLFLTVMYHLVHSIYIYIILTIKTHNFSKHCLQQYYSKLLRFIKIMLTLVKQKSAYSVDDFIIWLSNYHTNYDNSCDKSFLLLYFLSCTSILQFLLKSIIFLLTLKNKLILLNLSISDNEHYIYFTRLMINFIMYINLKFNSKVWDHCLGYFQQISIF